MKSPSFAEFRPSSPAASSVKRRNRGCDTRPELLLRRALWRLGARYRLHVAALPGRPDVVFVSAKLAVFCDGDFWHGRNWAARRRRLSRGSNPAYWIPKILANRARDRHVMRELAALGWSVARVWETDVIRDPDAVAIMLLRKVRKAIGPYWRASWRPMRSATCRINFRCPGR
jgi:DNA mismatch endonuclease (patch repair protein)